MTGMTDQDVDNNLAVKMDKGVKMEGDDSSDDEQGMLFVLLAIYRV